MRAGRDMNHNIFNACPYGLKRSFRRDMIFTFWQCTPGLKEANYGFMLSANGFEWTQGGQALHYLPAICGYAVVGARRDAVAVDNCELV